MESNFETRTMHFNTDERALLGADVGTRHPFGEVEEFFQRAVSHLLLGPSNEDRPLLARLVRELGDLNMNIMHGESVQSTPCSVLMCEQLSLSPRIVRRSIRPHASDASNTCLGRIH